jgi:hypothetical protein
MNGTEGIMSFIDAPDTATFEGTVSVGDPMPRLGSVALHDGMQVTVSWRSGLRAGKADIVDLAPAIMTYKLYRPLRDNAELLKSVHLTADGAAIAWGSDDAIDMAATTVERLAEETLDSSDFRAWLERHSFTYEAASAQLGISRRLVGYYASRRRVPRYIALACLYLDSQRPTQVHSTSATLIGESTLSADAVVIPANALSFARALSVSEHRDQLSEALDKVLKTLSVSKPDKLLRRSASEALDKRRSASEALDKLLSVMEYKLVRRSASGALTGRGRTRERGPAAKRGQRKSV